MALIDLRVHVASPSTGIVTTRLWTCGEAITVCCQFPVDLLDLTRDITAAGLTWRSPLLFADLDALQEGQATLCSDTGEMWIRFGGNLLQVANG